MSALTSDRNVAGGVALDVGEIRSYPDPARGSVAPRAPAYPDESSPPPVVHTPGPIEPLTRFLGPLLTVASPAWGIDPIPGMRALQKKLVEHSLTLDEDDRSECLAAITIVEGAVQLRLRYQQMRMNELERELGLGTSPESERAQ